MPSERLQVARREENAGVLPNEIMPGGIEAGVKLRDPRWRHFNSFPELKMFAHELKMCGHERRRAAELL
jgi:hypothetical protein